MYLQNIKPTIFVANKGTVVIAIILELYQYNKYLSPNRQSSGEYATLLIIMESSSCDEYIHHH